MVTLTLSVNLFYRILHCLFSAMVFHKVLVAYKVDEMFMLVCKCCKTYRFMGVLWLNSTPKTLLHFNHRVMIL